MRAALPFRKWLPALILLAAPSAFALVNLDEGRNRIDLSATASAGHDSNLFATAGGAGDDYFSLQAESLFGRHAGLISLDAAGGVNVTKYRRFRAENSTNPFLRATFSKDTGRTTGSFSLSAARESRADTAANLRDESWSYESNLTANYKLHNGLYAFTGNLGTSYRDFTDNTLLTDLHSFSVGMDFDYLLGERSLFAGYRFRRETSSGDNGNHDHAYTIGISGPLAYGLNGTLRAGYQLRNPTGATADPNRHRAWTSTADLTWSLSRQLSLTGQLSKDFSTASTDETVDALAAGITGRLQLNSGTTITVGTNWGKNRYFDAVGGTRRDQDWGWSAGVQHALLDDDHLNLAVSYATNENWSTASFADYRRNVFTVSASSKY